MDAQDPLRPHSHEPNPEPPGDDPVIQVLSSAGASVALSPAALTDMPRRLLENCMIVSTGHPSTGPFTFGGVALGQLIAKVWPDEADWTSVEVISADGFGTRVRRDELAEEHRPILICDEIDGRPLSRQQGLVRLIVPSETDDALRQVKWIAHINLVRR